MRSLSKWIVATAVLCSLSVVLLQSQMPEPHLNTIKTRFAGSGTTISAVSQSSPINPPGPPLPTTTTSLILDDFEDEAIRVVQPFEPEIKYQKLWNSSSRPLSFSGFTTADKHDGDQSLMNDYAAPAAGGNWQYHFYPYTVRLPDWADGWQYAKKFIKSGVWTENTYNPMRFWIKLPPRIAYADGGNLNFEIGTFVRGSTSPLTAHESDNRHYYHRYNLASTGRWEQMLVDMHPSAQRQGGHECSEPSGRGECGPLYHPTDEPAFNYFDLITGFYFDFPYVTGNGFKGTFLMDSVEFYVEPQQENDEQIYSVHSVYIPETREVRVGWSHKKGETVAHEVRYAWTDIHASGWAAATGAPGGRVRNVDGGGYNAMRWKGVLPVEGQALVYIAIKPVGATLFTQISVPLQ